MTAVRGVSYALPSARCSAIVGESGSGKSVSAMAVMGLLPKSARITGQIMLEGDERAGDASPKQRVHYAGATIAMVFQDPMTALNPVYSVGDQLAEAVPVARVDVERKAALARPSRCSTWSASRRPKDRAQGRTRTSSRAACASA